jgi:cellulose synthase/poly-beta-1,6-N-acetylglucosamine synthase-like glycosyltransferase
MWAYYFFAIISVCLGFESLRGGVRFLRYVREEISEPFSDFTPFVSIIVPCRGIDQGLKENLSKLFGQKYPQYEIIFTTDSETDESLAVIESLRTENQHIETKTVIAGQATDSGQKVHNLRDAVQQAKGEVFVFVDSDARPNKDWLQNLVAPLSDENIGAATGYRWFITAKGGFSSHLRAVWNASIVSQLGVNEKRNFCWGGSTAIRRETFERLNVSERWRGVVSDDFALTRMLQEANLPIRFVAKCLTVSVEDCSFHELIEFTTRQMKITRTYSRNLWKMALIGNAIFVFSFYVSIALIVFSVSFVPLIFFILMFVFGIGKAWLRLKAVSLLLSDYKDELRQSAFAQLTLWIFSPLLFLFNSIAAGFSRRIIWRGIEYELKSPTETIIIRSSDY